MSRCAQGGQAIRAVALLPGVVGAYARPGGGALLMTVPGFGIDPGAIWRPSGPERTRLVLRVSDETPRGVVLVPGQRPAGEAVAGTVNMLCSTRYTDLGEGASYQGTRLGVRAAP